MTRGYSSIPDGICENCGASFPRTTHHPRNRFCGSACAMRHRRGVSLPPPNPSGLCMCGCGEPTNIAKRSDTRAMALEGHPLRYLPNHQARSKTPPFIEKDMGYETTCHVWQRTISSAKYGNIYDDGRVRLAHVVAWEHVNGPVPDGFVLDHLCRVRACINPAHLEPVTNTVNIQRGKAAKANPDVVRYVRAMYGEKSSKQLAMELGLSQSTVQRIVSGARWSNIT